MPLLLLLLLLLLIQQVSCLYDWIPMRARGGSLYKTLLSEAADVDQRNGILRNTSVNYFDQLIWHNDSTKGTFKQRYYFDTSAWDSSLATPIMVYIGGEGPLGGTAGGHPAEVAKQLNAIQFALEHRYYGDSFPSTLMDTVTLQTLTVDTALEDLAVFIRAMKSSWQLTGKVIVIGGSYPGALSSWFRQKYPDVADISWSSSGVVNAVYNFTAFDQQ